METERMGERRVGISWRRERGGGNSVTCTQKYIETEGGGRERDLHCHSQHHLCSSFNSQSEQMSLDHYPS